MSNVFKKFTKTPVFRYPHSFLENLAGVKGTTRRANACALLSYILEKRQDILRVTRQEAIEGSGLYRKILPDAIADINEHIQGVEVTAVSRTELVFKISWYTDGMRRRYFEEPEAQRYIKSAFAKLTYAALCSEMDRTGSTRLRIPYVLTADRQGRAASHAVKELARQGFVQELGNEVEVLNPDTCRSLKETVANEDDRERVYCFDNNAGRNVWLDFNDPSVALRYYRETLKDDLHLGQNNVRCIFHDDDHASLSINIDTGEFNCHVCGWVQGSKLVTFEMSLPHSKGQADAQAKVNKKLGIRIVPPPHGDRESEHIYRDSDGKTSYRIERFTEAACMSRYVLGKWKSGIDGIERLLYNLPEVITSGVVIITEGEKKADMVSALQLKDVQGRPVAVTCTGGKDSWRDKFAQRLLGKQVIIMPDDDAPGRKYGEAIEGSCRRSGIDFSIVTFEAYGRSVKEMLNQHSVETQRDALLKHIKSQWLEKGISI